MDHGPAVELGQDNASDIKARIGLVLFVIYGLVYAGFVVINTVSPKTMSETIIFDLNLAVVYGFGLIMLAIVMGLIYNAICTRYEKRLNTEESEPS
ncbi:MAG: DUF485 domain-containing protein [Chloroflexi bacterium]|nr:DUF485 domain-containing protein [Chloroflexota bacterium]